MRSWRAVNGLFLTTTILEGLAFGHITAYTPLFLSDELGMSPAEVSAWTGILYAVMTGLAFPLAPFWGALAERYSRRLVIVRSQYLEMISYVIMAFAPNVWWLLGARILLGLTFGNFSVVIATQAQLTPRRHVGTAIATLQAAQPVAASIGPPIGALLIGLVGIRGLFVVDAVLAVIAALLITFVMPEPPKSTRKASVLARTGQSLALVWRRPALRWNFLCLFLSQGARAVVDLYLPVRITEVSDDPAPQIGFILGVAGVVTGIGTLISAKLVDEHGGVRWLLPSMLLAALATIGVAVFSDLRTIAILTWVRALPAAVATTVPVAHLTRVVAPEDQTVVLSLTPLPRNMAMFVMPIIAAAVAPFGVGIALSVGAVGYVLSAVTGWITARKTPAQIAAPRAPPERGPETGVT
jgi:DHA1 family multidrug resistance protein-like MFS transporter